MTTEEFENLKPMKGELEYSLLLKIGVMLHEILGIKKDFEILKRQEQEPQTKSVVINILEKPEPVTTTVTVWWIHGEEKLQKLIKTMHNIDRQKLNTCNKGEYSIDGIPDISTIITETLDKGALAIKVTCTEDFQFTDDEHTMTDTVYLWKGEVDSDGWEYEEYNGLFSHTDADIESAITDYLAKEKPKPEYKLGDFVVPLDIYDMHGIITNIKDNGRIVFDTKNNPDCEREMSEVRHATTDEINDAWHEGE